MAEHPGQKADDDAREKAAKQEQEETQKKPSQNVPIVPKKKTEDEWKGDV